MTFLSRFKRFIGKKVAKGSKLPPYCIMCVAHRSRATQEQLARLPCYIQPIRTYGRTRHFGAARNAVGLGGGIVSIEQCVHISVLSTVVLRTVVLSW